MTAPPVKAVFFDVDFTLIYPGPTFQGEGYERFCTRYGIKVDPARFADAVIEASTILDEEQEAIYLENRRHRRPDGPGFPGHFRHDGPRGEDGGAQ